MDKQASKQSYTIIYNNMSYILIQNACDSVVQVIYVLKDLKSEK